MGSLGSSGGSFGRAVPSDTRGPRFESSHRQQKLYWTFAYFQLYWKDENKEKYEKQWSRSICVLFRLIYNIVVLVYYDRHKTRIYGRNARRPLLV